MIIISLLPAFVIAQYRVPMKAIIDTYGTPDKTGIADESMYYIGYENQEYSECSGKIVSYYIGYFIGNSAINELCDYWCWILPACEANGFVKMFNENYVQQSTYSWINHENNTIFSMTTSYGFCKIICESL
ncbi:MAG: hypothetical protein IPO24_17195 [Bacteroidetes bacterium]|jgi:hypothetical protein|nr:hypothetical protein [Bacteroidota bacterium]